MATPIIDEIVLGVSEGIENEIFRDYAVRYGIKLIVGDQADVLARLIQCGIAGSATDIFRVTSESPFRYHEFDEVLWEHHLANANDATFLENIIDGCGSEIVQLSAFKKAHSEGEARHRSELCTLYIRENPDIFRIERIHSSYRRQPGRLDSVPTGLCALQGSCSENPGCADCSIS